MPAQVGGFLRDANVVTGAFGDLTIASRADVTLQRLVGLHTADLDVAVQTIPDRF